MFHGWMFDPDGDQAAADSTRSSTTLDTGASVNPRTARRLVTASYTSIIAYLPPAIAMPVMKHRGPEGPPSAQRPHPASDGPPDLVRRIFLNEMYPRDRDLGLRWPRADRVEIRAAAEERTGFRLYEQLGHITRRQPFRIGSHDRIHVGGFALDRDLPRPRQRRPSPFAGLCERPPVLRHLFGGEGA